MLRYHKQELPEGKIKMAGIWGVSPADLPKDLQRVLERLV
jgi:hypothetical protein